MLLLDLPLIRGDEPEHAPAIAVFARPWPGAVAVALGTPDSGYLPRQAVEQAAVMGNLVTALAPGPSWRLDRANQPTVRLHGGALASVPLAAMLNGANIAAIGTPEAGYEVIQFRLATLVDINTWRLGELLRGQAGTGDVMAAGHGEGARFVLLNGAVPPLAISAAEAGLALIARCGAADTVYDPEDFVDVPVIPAVRGTTCLAPVQLRARRDAGTGDVAVSWIRQTRIGGDAWEPVEVPLGEAGEAYRVEILDGAVVLRTATTAAPAFAMRRPTRSRISAGRPPRSGCGSASSAPRVARGSPPKAS